MALLNEGAKKELLNNDSECLKHIEKLKKEIIMRRITEKECPYCSNPQMNKWTQDCNYVGFFEDHADFVRSTFDPPCAMDAHDDTMDEIQQRNVQQIAGSVFWVCFGIFMLMLLYAR